MKLSNRVLSMQESPIRKLVPLAEAAKAAGKTVYHLNIGQPDIETPAVFMDAIRAFDEPVIEYSFSQGDPKLIHAIMDYYKGHDIHFEEDEVLITNGGSEALIYAVVATCDKDDEVLVPEPFYTNYNGFANEVSVNVKPILTYAEDGFHLPTKEKIVELITPKTKAIMFSNPGNPTGVVYTEDEIRMLADIAKEYNLYLIADEVYREFTYDNLKFTSCAHLTDVQDRVIVCDSVSKRYSACGARIGCIASKNKELIRQVLKLCQSRLCVPTLEQVGAAALYRTPQKYLDDVNKEYTKRRNIVYETLHGIDGVICEKPTGAFYVIAKLPIEDAEDFVVWMLSDFEHNNQTVMFAPAAGFYATEGLGKNEIRIAYVLKEEDLRNAMEVLQIGLEQYRNR